MAQRDEIRKFFLSLCVVNRRGLQSIAETGMLKVYVAFHPQEVIEGGLRTPEYVLSCDWYVPLWRKGSPIAEPPLVPVGVLAGQWDAEKGFEAALADARFYDHGALVP